MTRPDRPQRPDDPYDLARFVEAQAPVYAEALSEIRRGRKRTHWMWYIFPQLAGLAASPTSTRYAITGADEARAYLDHAILGPRLLECTASLIQLEGRSATDVLGTPDDLKLRSCATLFAYVSPPDSLFERLLERYYRGAGDPRTLQLLESAGERPGGPRF